MAKVLFDLESSDYKLHTVELRVDSVSVFDLSTNFTVDDTIFPAAVPHLELSTRVQR